MNSNERNLFIKKKDFESKNEYIARIYKHKNELGYTNKDCQQTINDILHTEYSESTLRSIAYPFIEGFNIGFEQALITSKNTECTDKIRLEKELVNLKLENEQYKQIKSFKESNEFKKDGSYSSEKLIGIENDNELKNEKFLLQVHGYDINDWTIISAKNSIWNTQIKGGKIIKLYASKINVKPRTKDISMDELEKWFKNFDRKHTTLINYEYDNNDNEDILFELPLVDVHFGKRGYKIDIGKNVDSDYTENNFFNVILDYKNRLKDKHVSRILFPIGNDLFNTDTVNNTTTKGTQQDNDMKWKELFKKGSEMVIEAIEILSTIAPVDVIYVEGNHDTITSYHLLLVINAWFRNTDRVNVSTNVQTRQYYKWGECLIGYSHGDCEGKRIERIMQDEVPNMWGTTRFREFHLAHLHHETSDEIGSITIRHLPSIMGGDAWHYKSGWIGQLQRCQAFLWDKHKGLTDILYSQIIE